MTASSVRFLVLGLLLGVCAAAAGAETILGMPAPRDPKKPGSLVLHGGGRISEDVFERFIELAGGKQARIVLVPCAGYRPADYDTEEEYLDALNSRFGAWVRLESSGRIRSFRFLYTDDPDDSDRTAFVRPLESATGVWFSGGSQARLNYRFVGDHPETTRFQDALQRIVEQGGVVGGTSAGMAILPEVITLAEDYDYSSAPATAVAAHGFGLLKRAIVEQHFDARGGRLERFTGLLRDAPRLDDLAGRKDAGVQMAGLAVEQDGALVVQGNRLEALGGAHTHVFLKSHNGRTITWHDMAPGDTAQLRRAVPSSPVLLREENVLTP
jgi:cyanophycinase